MHNHTFFQLLLVNFTLLRILFNQLYSIFDSISCMEKPYSTGNHRQHLAWPGPARTGPDRTPLLFAPPTERLVLVGGVFFCVCSPRHQRKLLLTSILPRILNETWLTRLQAGPRKKFATTMTVRNVWKARIRKPGSLAS